MEFYQLVLSVVLIFGVQICLPVWIIGYKLKLPGNDIEARNLFKIQVIASFMFGLLLAIMLLWGLVKVFPSAG